MRRRQRPEGEGGSRSEYKVGQKLITIANNNRESERANERAVRQEMAVGNNSFPRKMPYSLVRSVALPLPPLAASLFYASATAAECHLFPFANLSPRTVLSPHAKRR